MNRLLSIILFTLCCFAAAPGRAQTDTCITHLKDAQTDLDQGDYDEAITFLTSCLANCHLDKGDKISAYKNLILCYLSIDNLEAADEAARKIMKLSPTFVPNKFKDDYRLISVFEKYKPIPMFAFGISAGLNAPQLTSGSRYSVVYEDGQAPATYKTTNGYQLGMQAERKLFHNLWIEAAFSYRNSSYQHTLDSVLGANDNFTEKFINCDLPLSLKYYFPTHRFMPYVQAGAVFSFITSDLSTTTRKQLKDILDQAPYRNTYTTGYFGAIGLCYKVKSLMLFANARYSVFPDNVNKAGTRFSNQVNLFKFYYVDDDFKLNNTQYNFGASLILKYKNLQVNTKNTK